MSKAIVICLLFSITSLLSTNEIYGDVRSGGKYLNRYSGFIHVVRNPDQSITFQYCEGSNVLVCHYLGSKEKYQLNELRRRQQVLRQERRMMILTDTTFIVTSALGALITTIAAPTPVGPMALTVYAASGAAGAGIYVLRSYLAPGASGPRSKLKDVRILSDRLLDGQHIDVNEPIGEFAQRLDEILKGIY